MIIIYVKSHCNHQEEKSPCSLNESRKHCDNSAKRLLLYIIENQSKRSQMQATQRVHNEKCTVLAVPYNNQLHSKQPRIIFICFQTDSFFCHWYNVRHACMLEKAFFIIFLQSYILNSLH